MINDYYLINNMQPLFEKKIVIYGAGNYGRKMLALLESVEINVEYFCDKNLCGRTFLDKTVVDIHTLKKMTENENIAIVIASEKYMEEIIKDIKNEGIDIPDIYTFFGVKNAIEFHIKDACFSEEVRKEFLIKKEIYLRNKMACSEAGIVVSVLQCGFGILVYQPAKVGSSSVMYSLRRHGIQAMRWHSCQSAYLEKYKADFQVCKEYLKEPLKVISLVREPITREISECFQLYGDERIDHEIIGNTLEEDVLGWLDRRSLINYEFTWFDKELKEFIGIDVYEHDFDRENGYAIIRNENVELLLLQMEQLDTNQQIIADFIGISDFKLIKENVGAVKPYHYAYADLKKNIKIPQEIIERYYKNNEKMNHFYSEQQRNDFLKMIKPMMA